MSTKNKGILGSILLAALVLASGFSFATSAQADVTQTNTYTTTTLSATDLMTLQNEIATLTSEVQSLQAQLAARILSMNTTGGTTMVNSSTCYSFNGNDQLAIGSQGTEVNTLQSFLIAKGYLAISAPTGYYGVMTDAALKQYQTANGLAGSSYGVLDSATIAKISSSCEMTMIPAPTTTTTNNTTTNTSPTPGTAMTIAPVISYFSSPTATPGSTVTINGTGFGNGNSTVYLTGPSGNMTVTNTSMINNGNGLTFTVPMTNAMSSACAALTSTNCTNYLTPGTYTVYVQNGNGTSNYTTLNVNPYNVNATSTPMITSFSNMSGGIGSTITITGTGFMPTGNSVMFGTTTITNLSSTNNGTTLQFTVPVTSSSNSAVATGNYNVSVVNPNGTSNSMMFMVQ